MSAMPASTPHKNSWATGAFHTRALSVPDWPTAFDQLVYKLGLEHRPDLWQYNSRLRSFAHRNRMTRYVPEQFLRELGIEVEVDL